MISKIIMFEYIENIFNSIKNKTIVFTNGCFDILHAGHVTYLEAAKAYGDILVVGLNSDSSIKTIKGEKRPIICQNQRAKVLSSLCFVDYIIIFDESNPFKLIQKVNPDIIVKGEDWAEDKIIGSDFMKKKGGKIVRINLVPSISTSEIIKRIVDKYKEDL